MISNEHEKGQKRIKMLVGLLIEICVSVKKTSINKTKYKIKQNSINMFLKYGGLNSIKNNPYKYAEFIQKTIKMYNDAKIVDNITDTVTVESLSTSICEHNKYGYYIVEGIDILFKDIWYCITDKNLENYTIVEKFTDCLNKINYWGNMYIQKSKIIDGYKKCNNTDEINIYIGELIYHKKFNKINKKTIIRKIQNKLKSDTSNEYINFIYKLYIADEIYLKNLYEQYIYIPANKIEINRFIYKNELQGLQDNIKTAFDHKIDNYEDIQESGPKYKKKVAGTLGKLVDDVIGTLETRGYNKTSDLEKQILGQSNIHNAKNEVTQIIGDVTKKAKKTLKSNEQKTEAADAALSLLDELKMDELGSQIGDGGTGLIGDTLTDAINEFKNIFKQRKRQIKNGKVNMSEHEKKQMIRKFSKLTQGFNMK